MAKASVASGDLIDGYLRELRRRLEGTMVRNSRERVVQIAAEAEDHLREATAARVAAGMSEQDAQRAAIAAFGEVRIVIRAHRPRAAAVLATVAMALCALLGTYALIATVAGWAYAFWVVRWNPAGYSPSFGMLALIGIALLAVYFTVRRQRRANGGAARVVPLPSPFYPVTAVGMLLLGRVELAAPLYGLIPAPLVRLRGDSFLLGSGAVFACGILCLACVLWSAVLVVRWIAARVTASRQPAAASA